MKRKQQDIITKDLAMKMVFITGPRQVGKTSLALAISKNFEKSLYLNYDTKPPHQQILVTGWKPSDKAVILWPAAFTDIDSTLFQWRKSPTQLQMILISFSSVAGFRNRSLQTQATMPTVGGFNILTV